MPLAEIIDLHAVRREKIVSQVTAAILRQWTELGSWNRDDIEAFVSRVVPVVRAGQQLTAQLVDLYVAEVMAEMLGHSVAPLGLSPDKLTDLRGVDPSVVYTRPAIQLWSDLAKGVLFPDALDAATNRVGELVDDDMSLAYRTASKEVMTERKSVIKGYRRVIRPELSRGGACPLCQTASENFYHTGDLLPIHTHCRCTVVPVIGRRDPGADLNAEDVTDEPVDITVHEHGELGPILYPAGQGFTGPSQIEAA